MDRNTQNVPVNSKGLPYYPCSCGQPGCTYDWHHGNGPYDRAEILASLRPPAPVSEPAPAGGRRYFTHTSHQDPKWVALVRPNGTAYRVKSVGAPTPDPMWDHNADQFVKDRNWREVSPADAIALIRSWDNRANDTVLAECEADLAMQAVMNSAEVMYPTPKADLAEPAPNEISGGMGGLIDAARLAPRLPTAAEERAAHAEPGDGEADAAEWAERMVTKSHTDADGKDVVTFLPHENASRGGYIWAMTGGTGEIARAEMVQYIAAALVAFARRPRPERPEPKCPACDAVVPSIEAHLSTGCPPTPAATDAVRTAAARLLEALAARNITDEWPVISGPMKALRAALASAPGQGEARPRAEWYVSNGTVTVSLPSGTAFDYHCLTREHAEHLQAAVNWPAGSGVVVLQQTAEAVRRWASSPVTDKAALGALFDALTSDPALARPSEPAHGGEVGR
jgi:hypothetical protein